MLFEKSGVGINTDLDYLLNISSKILGKSSGEILEILRRMLLEMKNEGHTFKEAMTLLSVVIDNRANDLYAESFEAVLRNTRASVDALELYNFVRKDNFKEGKMVLELLGELIKSEMESANSDGGKARILANIIMNAEKDDELVEKLFPSLVSLAESAEEFQVWHAVCRCAIRHEYKEEGITAIEKMSTFEIGQGYLSEMILLCSYLTYDDRRTEVLLLGIKTEIKRICKGSAKEELKKWIEVLNYAQAGSKMELYASKMLSAVLEKVIDFVYARSSVKSGRARRILAKRGIELAEDIRDLQTAAVFAKNDPEIFQSALERINALEDSITKYYMISGLRKEWEASAYEKIINMQPANEEEVFMLRHAKEKIK